MTDKKRVLSRRNFLLSVGAGSAATAAAIVGTKTAETAKVAGNDKRATSGYQVSEHINNYYRTTKV